MPINVSPIAIEELHRLLKKEDKEDWGLRVGVKGGGCSGLSYTMDLAERSNENDKIVKIDGINIFCDVKSYLFLNGMTLDFTSELMTGGFKFVNPNATRTCSCGESFSA